jgi:hypothetical protein
MARGGHGLLILSLPCPTLLRPAGRPLLKRPYGRFRGGWPIERAARGCIITPLNTPRLTPMVSGEFRDQGTMLKIYI